MIEINNIQNCVQDVLNTASNKDTGPEDPSDLKELESRLEKSKHKLPPLYQNRLYEPFMIELKKLDQKDYTILIKYQRIIGDILIDIAQSILQNGEGYNEIETDAFQEVIYDLYDGFLSAEDRKGVKPPNREVIPPLAKWGRPDDGPYTDPVDATNESFNVDVAIVSLPPSFAKSGILAWSALGHETAGHDILHADTGLREELADAVLKALKQAHLGKILPRYWSIRIDETASDVLGILNMGPAAAIGLIGFFRGLVGSFTSESKLRSEGPAIDPHPADILRGYLAASTVDLLHFNDAANWSKIIEEETDKDLSTIILEENEVSIGDAKKSAQIVASTIVNTKLEALENTSLGRIQDWRNSDEDIVKAVRTAIKGQTSELSNNTYAAHVVAAAVMEALSGEDTDIPSIFNQMIKMLKTMNDRNPSWGPLYVIHAGNLVKHSVLYKYK